MSTSPRETLEVGGLAVELVRKDIRNVHLAVYPPDGHVRIAVPLHVGDDAARLAVVDKLAWVRRQRDAFARQPRLSTREVVTGESHYVWGRRVRLNVVEADAPPAVRRLGPTRLELRVRPGTGGEPRRRLLQEWYRGELKAAVEPLVASWEPRLGVQLGSWQVRRMRTRWGSCSPTTGRVLINLELAKKPPECLEFIVVHEMVHLMERTHSDRFRRLMDRHLPDWRRRREALNRLPLAHEDWAY